MGQGERSTGAFRLISARFSVVVGGILVTMGLAGATGAVAGVDSSALFVLSKPASGSVIGDSIPDAGIRPSGVTEPSSDIGEIALNSTGMVPLDLRVLDGLSSSALANEMLTRYRALGGTAGLAANQQAFEIWLIASTLLRDFPKSREALLLRKNRFFDVDLGLVTKLAEAWKSGHEELAAGYGKIEPPTELGKNIVSLLPEPDAEAPVDPASVAKNGQSDKPASWFLAPKLETTVSPPTKTAMLPVADIGKIAELQIPGSRRDLFERLKSTTVIVIQLGVLQNGQLAWFAHGTGSFISPTHILTNTHVVEADPGKIGNSFLIVNKALGVSRAVVVARGKSASDKGVDAAVLQALDVKSPYYLSFSSEFTEGDSVVLSGFAGKANVLDKAFVDLQDMVDSGAVPTSDQIPSPKFSSGNIQAVFTNTSGEETVAADIEATMGASGSALVNECGQMVALLYAVSTSTVDKQGYVDASTYNYSASAREVMNWLASARVNYSQAKTSCRQ